LANDVSSLLVGEQIPIAILDRNLRIRRFTPTAEKVLNLIPGDVGRPFTDIVSNLVVADWGQLSSEVLDHLRTVEREVQDRQGRWYALRMRPYRTRDNQIDGLLMPCGIAWWSNLGEQPARGRRSVSFLLTSG